MGLEIGLNSITSRNFYKNVTRRMYGTNREDSKPDIAYNVLNSNAKRSNDEDDSECEEKSATSADALRAVHHLRNVFTNSEREDVYLKTV
ncbi:hypothetical protein CEXT_391511 [Caerostris extrusa]|uniref:Uncharacterized protein n=1 Tax=Caerostris extrusa TaxID=172846 RepID=A0AAV4W2V1_CAEEX|nr:hypothetical protein CEXT_391511 [Caerostris extrusa]